MQNILIREAKPTDLPAIQDLCNTLSEQSFGFDQMLNAKWAHSTEGERYYSDRISQKEGIVFVAEKEGELLGFASISIHHSDEWRLIKRIELDNVFLKPHTRGMGLGKALIETVKSYATKQKAQRLVLNAYTKNEQAIAFYSHLGFTPYELTMELSLDK